MALARLIGELLPETAAVSELVLEVARIVELVAAAACKALQVSVLPCHE